MGIMRNWVSGAIITAMLATTATPAFARHGGGYYGGGSYGGQYGHRRHHDRGVSAGDVIAGVAILGVFAAIASAASKPKAPRYPEPVFNDYPQNDDRRTEQNRHGSINSENAAVDACATAAEERGGSTASVREITTVDANSDGWDVEGVVEQRSDWRDRSADRKRFTCSVRFGSVETVYIDGSSIAIR